MTTQRSETVAEDWGASRSRVVTWHDPGPSTAPGLTMAGLDYLQAMIDGTLPPPPICQLMRYDIAPTAKTSPVHIAKTPEPLDKLRPWDVYSRSSSFKG